MAYDAFLKIDGVTGESQKSGHKGEIELMSFSWGATNPTNVGVGTGLSAGKAKVLEFAVHKPVDQASPTLFTNCCAGKPYAKVTVALQKATGSQTGEVYLKYDFTNVFVTKIEWTGGVSSTFEAEASEHGHASETVEEQVPFAFEAVNITYKPQDATGKLGSQQVAGWNFSNNQKL